MNFLALLLVAVVEYFSSWRKAVQKDGLWLGLYRRLATDAGSGPKNWLRLIILVMPALVLGWVLDWVEGWLFGLVGLLIHMLVLLYSFGRGGIKPHLESFRNACSQNDQESAYLIARQNLGVDAEDPKDLALGVQKAMLWQAFDGFFAVAFWYVLLGPQLALAYRLLALASEQTEPSALRNLALRWRHVLDWLPARALALSFGLVGNFAAFSKVFVKMLFDPGIKSADLLLRVGRAATDDDVPTLDFRGNAYLDELWRLVVRAGVLWCALLALWVVFVR